jgi:two-component system C4-dicarboxylate transport response regulator DctD
MQPAPYRVLVVDDDAEMRASLEHLLETSDWQVKTLSRAAQVEGALTESPADVVLTDIRMPGMDGMTLLRNLREANGPPIVLMTAHGDIPMAVEAMQSGAYSFLEKPFDPRRLITILKHACEQFRLSQDAERLRARLARLSGLDRILIGETKAVTSLRQSILDIADIESPVLIQGETGTGKELAARALHDLGPRNAAAFVPVNCATLPAADFMEVMFGRLGENRGLVAGADGGTLFLDEVGACDAAVQAQLLRLLEAQEVVPIGAAQPERVNIRVISATNTDLAEAVVEGSFRADLYYRLNSLSLALPPLRDRSGDIPLIYNHFCGQYAGLYEASIPDTTAEDVAALLAHPWPGNVRELRSVAERRVLAARRGQGSVTEAIHVSDAPDDLPSTLREAVAAFERELISNAVRAHAGRMDAVAEALGIGRRTLNEKLVKLGLERDALL